MINYGENMRTFNVEIEEVKCSKNCKS